MGEQDIWGRPLKLAANQIHENTTDCSIRFQGQYFDSESRLHYNRFRYYSPGIAQYISPDEARGPSPTLKELQAQYKAQEQGDKPPKKGFKDYKPGFFHIDIKYLPQMPDQSSRSYLYVAIDRATRWVYFKTYPDQTENSSADFLRRLHKASPVTIAKILTDNGSQFTDRFTSKDKKPSGKHVFDRECKNFDIEPRLSPPRTPQMNGMVERFNGRIAELIVRTRFVSQSDLEQTLTDYCRTYNHHIVQRNIGGITPVQAMKEWQESDPQLFKKQVYNQTGLEN